MHAVFIYVWTHITATSFGKKHHFKIRLVWWYYCDNNLVLLCLLTGLWQLHEDDIDNILTTWLRICTIMTSYRNLLSMMVMFIAFHAQLKFIVIACCSQWWNIIIVFYNYDIIIADFMSFIKSLFSTLTITPRSTGFTYHVLV